MKYYHNTQDQPGEFFPMPKSIFRLGLISGEILVYAYLMYCEDRKTYQCHPSYATIGDAIGCSKNSVRKYVQGLERKGLITTERTSVKTKDELPMYLSVRDVADLLGISRASAYELVHEEDFPKLKVVAGRIIIPRDKLFEWLDQQTRYDRI